MHVLCAYRITWLLCIHFSVNFEGEYQNNLEKYVGKMALPFCTSTFDLFPTKAIY